MRKPQRQSRSLVHGRQIAGEEQVPLFFFHFVQKSVVSSTNMAYSLIRQEAVFVRMHG